MTDQFNIDVPTCHYCGRLAPEFFFESIHVCEKCLGESSAMWCLYQMPSGEYSVTPKRNPQDLSDWKYINEGTFIEMWELSLDTD